MVRASGDSIGTGSNMVLPGKYHLYIEEAEAELAKSGNYYFKCKLQVRAGTVDGMAGKEMKFQGFAGDKMFAIASACGLTDAITGQPYTRERLDKMRADKKAGNQVEDCDFDPDELIGRHFCAEVVHKKGEEWPQVGFGVWSVFDPEAAEIPKDAELMAALGVDVTQSQGGNGHAAHGNGGATATATKPATTTAKPASKFASDD
jgi:hypothetical protein